MVCEPHFHCVYLKSEWIHSAFLCLFHLDLPLCVCIEFMQCFRYNVQQRTATELPSRLYVAVWQMRFFQHRLHGIINLFGSKLCVLAFFIHTKESKLQKGKHKCIFVYTLQMLVACHCEWKKGKKEKQKQMPLQKGKCMVLKLPYNGRNTLHSDRSFMYHQQALHALCTALYVYAVAELRKRNRKWWALFLISSFCVCNFVTSFNSLFVVEQTNKRNTNFMWNCRRCSICLAALPNGCTLYHSQVAKLDRT